MTYWLVYGGILIAGGGLLALLFRGVGRQHKLLENVGLSLAALFLTGMGLELYFKLFFAQSDAFRYTLASQNWYERYWVENSLGYRDVEWTPERLAGKTKVMIVGDSFVAGSGIANPEDRFVGQLGRLLGPEYAVMVVASPGWDTLDEAEAIVKYPYRPDLLVLAYYVNDIEGVAYESGVERPQIRHDPPAWLNLPVQHSYALNFLYWRVVRLGPQEWAQNYWAWLKELNAAPDIRWQQRQQLLTIAEGAAAEEIPLVVVVFPHLAAVEESRPMTAWVLDLFAEQGTPTLDVSQMLAGRDPADTMVNAVDSHPNEAVNLEVARRLHEMIISASPPAHQ
jgi:hypothetical protein